MVVAAAFSQHLPQIHVRKTRYPPSLDHRSYSAQSEGWTAALLHTQRFNDLTKATQLVSDKTDP